MFLLSKFLADQLLQGDEIWSSFSLRVQQYRYSWTENITVAQNSFSNIYSQCPSNLERALEEKLWELSQVITSPSCDYYNMWLL